MFILIYPAESENHVIVEKALFTMSDFYRLLFCQIVVFILLKFVEKYL